MSLRDNKTELKIEIFKSEIAVDVLQIVFFRCMMIRDLTVAIGIVIAANVPAGAETLVLHPVLKTFQPMRIAAPDFVTSGVPEAGPAHEIAQLIVSDLKQTGIFAPLNPAVFADKTANIDQIPRFVSPSSYLLFMPTMVSS